MNEQGLFVATVAAAMYNGIFSPLSFVVFQWAPAWMPGFVPFSVATALYGSSLIVATATLLIGGLPAALYERYRRLPASSSTSCLIWLIGAILLTLPAIVTPLS